MKETFYFSHDYHARTDEKIIELLLVEKWEWYWLFWAIVEKLYENEWYIDQNYERIAYDLRTQCERIQKVVENYWLFIFDGKRITSKSVLERLRQRKDKSKKAQQSVKARWDKEKKGDTNVIRDWYERNTIKERKGKENKEKKNNTYTESFEIFWKEYPNRVGKPDALRKYKEQEHSEIMDWLTRWKEFWDYSETEPRFIPHPATWLNQERYKDETPETKPKTISVINKF